LDKLENIVNPKDFFRVNRQFIVNISSIENMYSLSKSRIKIELKPKPDNEIIVSYNRMSDFRKWLNI
ncbi:MAG: LytTR family transcriptional regulator DNA-binding domain-containing protein, partial [Bacteroidales bacterium]|nr:LytTR family transcriptional regulator DNA-binding domain-containing protein [Bacteroidales bacterium]